MTAPPATATIPVFDGHNDTLFRLAISRAFSEEGEERSFFRESKAGHIDLPRARRGGMAGGLFAIFPAALSADFKVRTRTVNADGGYDVPISPPLAFEVARDFTLDVLAILEELEAKSNQEFGVARDITELHAGIRAGRLVAVIHFEGAEAIDEDLEMLEYFYERGLRSLGIVWSRPNAFGTGVPFRYPGSPDIGPGLTLAGRRLVRACNEMGILIDMAHLNEAGFWDVAELSDRPLVVSHACCHAICPSTRNLTDRQLDAIGESGGLVGVNFFVGDLREDGLVRGDTPVEQIVRHIDYAASRIGIDHVAFGSDFDGARMPDELGDVAGLPRLIDALRRSGYDDQALRKVAYQNWLRVLDQTWAAS